MSFDAEKLYNLLPSVYRIRDAEQGEVLRQLVDVIAKQVAAVEEDIDQLYDDQFIETCAEWVIPYIGDLIGYRDLYDISPKLGPSRAEVANTIAYRRRKGTTSMLEQLARDVTGWDAAVVEFFQRLATTQYMNHVRHDRKIPNMRNVSALANINTPFDKLPHTVDVRRIASGRGFYNIQNVGIFLWRVQSYPLSESPPFRVDARRYLFSPLGNNVALYNRPQPEEMISHLATSGNVPAPLTRRYLAENIAAHYGEGLSLWVRRGNNVADINEVHICDLSDIEGGGWANMPSAGLAIDPELGRLAFSEDVDTNLTPLQCSFRYGFSADIGGGEYDRSTTLSTDTPVQVPDDHAAIQGALDANAGRGVVEVVGSGRYKETLQIFVRQNRNLILQAGNNSRPTIMLSNELVIGGGDSGEVTLNGLLISGGQLRVPTTVNGVENRLQLLRLWHCTLVPGIALNQNGAPQQSDSPSLLVDIPNVLVEIEDCIVGGLQINANSRAIIRNSIVDATDLERTAYSAGGDAPGGVLEIENATVIGKVNAQALTIATNTLFLSTVHVERVQEGCVRFSYVPFGSRVPRRYRCRPEAKSGGKLVRPQFTSLRYGEPGYCQLRPYCAAEIREGADDESEMGAFHDLYQAQRETNLRIRLREYLRFGLEAGIFYVS
jgi:hypothetical protein